MTFAVGHVEGGTGAGRKRPLRDKPKPWRCRCAMDKKGYRDPVVADWREQPAYMSRCPVCKQERP